MLSYFFVSKGFYKEDNTTPNDVVLLESKQNSDATGLLYQWGRKDPFTFATKSTGTGGGLNPLKIYNAQGKEIVQTLNGLSDTNGVITIVTELASSMIETVKKPNTYYAVGTLISQTELTKDIWDYYWTSYSRGTDGHYSPNDPNVSNSYSDNYTQQRTKSLFDPCPYGFKVPTNGTFNKFVISYIKWIVYSYIGGVKYNVDIRSTWFLNNGYRRTLTGLIYNVGAQIGYKTSTISNVNSSFALFIAFDRMSCQSRTWSQTEGHPIRCIEDFTGC